MSFIDDIKPLEILLLNSCIVLKFDVVDRSSVVETYKMPDQVIQDNDPKSGQKIFVINSYIDLYIFQKYIIKTKLKHSE